MCLLSLYGMAQTEPVFSKEQLTLGDGSALPYRQMRIEGSLPRVVVYLHGDSGCGTDNETQMTDAGIDSIAYYLLCQDVPTVFVVPQCSNKTKGWSSMATQVKQLLDYVAQHEAADTTRIYILGSSMGGTGTWKIVSLYSDYFAAAMPCAGDPKDTKAEDIASTPVYTVMGLADKVMGNDVRATVEALVSQLRTMGANVIYEAIRGWTHEMTCIQSYSTPRLDRLFSHQREPSTDLTTSSIDTGDDGWYDLLGRCYTVPATQGVFIHKGKIVVLTE